MKKNQGCVYLVGAGCGAADLLTLRGEALLRKCDAVVYDDLIANELLSFAPDHAEKIYMGKRNGKHSASQPEICSMLINKAKEGKIVVRLKGGDPFVFGRGGEEILALQEADIPYEEVPGISSAIAIPAAAGIPVTHRGISRSVHIITAHTADTPDGLPPYLDDLARLPGTLVFLMGLTKLEQIARRLVLAGMAESTPAAVVSGGNAPYPMAVRGTLETLAQKALEANVQPPAVIVVGNVAAMDLSATMKKPLVGMRIGLTGTAAITQKLRRGLEAHGAQVFDAVCSKVEELPFDFDLKNLCEEKQWVVFTSSNGVRLFFKHLAKQRIDLRKLHNCKFAVIGASTAAKLSEYGIQADLCPERYTSEDLAKVLCQKADPEEKIILFRSRLGSKELFRTLSEKYTVQDVPLYDLRNDSLVAEAARPYLEQVDYLTFSSASGVELFIQAHGQIPEQAVCVCIGNVTAAALQRVYHKPFLTAPEISADGIVQSILTEAESTFADQT